jgi:hypothetical protein
VPPGVETIKRLGAQSIARGLVYDHARAAGLCEKRPTMGVCWPIKAGSSFH